MIIIVAGFIPFSNFGTEMLPLSRTVINVSHSALTLFLWIVLVDVSQHTKRDALIVFACGWILRSASFWIAFFVSRSTMTSITIEIAFNITVLVLIAMAYLLSGCRSLDHYLLSGLQASLPLSQNTDQRCKELALEYSLTDRETEVLIMLAHGRSRPYIAENLVISENTVLRHRGRFQCH
ncbi:MAG: hypothetical protein IKE43_04005 [Coriobacteriales bacterium]|nr:hypothetical protein [Coriobacteriales bacterium]